MHLHLLHAPFYMTFPHKWESLMVVGVAMLSVRLRNLPGCWKTHVFCMRENGIGLHESVVRTCRLLGVCVCVSINQKKYPDEDKFDAQEKEKEQKKKNLNINLLVRTKPRDVSLGGEGEKKRRVGEEEEGRREREKRGEEDIETRVRGTPISRRWGGVGQ